MAELVLSVDVDAEPPVVWRALTDWHRQGEWMIATTVRPTYRDGQGAGGQLEARTGLGPLAVVDSMTITAWEPPYRCLVRHTGRAIAGAAAFEVAQLPGGRSRFTWAEWLELPMGALGQAGFLVVRPLVAAGIRRSLRQFADWVVRRELG